REDVQRLAGDDLTACSCLIEERRAPGKDSFPRPHPFSPSIHFGSSAQQHRHVTGMRDLSVAKPSRSELCHCAVPHASCSTAHRKRKVKRPWSLILLERKPLSSIAYPLKLLMNSSLAAIASLIETSSGSLKPMDCSSFFPISFMDCAEL